jgi:hypothetical protein
MAFAIINGNFGSASTWDTGVVPSGSEDAYANGFTIQVTGTQSCNAVRSDFSDYRFINTATPLMTSNTSPSGEVSATTVRTGGEAFRAFDRNLNTFWGTADFVSTGTLTYKFPSTRIIKRYMVRAGLAIRSPRTWTFQGSVDGIVWTDGVGGNPAPLDTQTNVGFSDGSVFTSGLINTGNTPYQWYRIVITVMNGTWPLQVAEMEMTESTSTSVGQIAGGTFILNNGSNLTCTSSQGIYIGSTTAVVQFTGGTASNATFQATLPAAGLPNAASQTAVLHSGQGTLNIIGDITFGGGLSGQGTRTQVTSNSTGILRIIGNVSSAGGGIETGNSCIVMAAGWLYINGDVIGGGISRGFMISGGTSVIEITGNVNATGVANVSGGSSITVIGDITNTNTIAAITTTSGTILVTGAITVSNTGAGVATTTGVVTLGGPITASNSGNAVTSSALVKCSGLLFNTNQFQAVWAPKITIEPTTTSITYQTFASGNQIMYVGSSGALGQPTTNNVRFGTVYGAANEFG